MAERKLSNWLHGFLEYTKESEAPDNYLLWTAISTLAGATQRQISTKWGYLTIYPNMYTMLVGPPGFRKSTALSFGRGLLRAIGVPMSSESMSKEAMITQMVERNKMKKPPRSALTVLSSDFMTFMQTSGPSMIEFLTDIYDSPDKWEYTTKQRGSEVVKNGFVNLLAATTPGWISDTFSISFIEQGFASRCLFIYEDKLRFLRAFPKVTPEMEEVYLALIEDLQYINKLKGVIPWTQAGHDWFENWYEKEHPKELLDYRLSGYLRRKPTHVLKLAMILALSERDDKIQMDSKNISAAKRLLDFLEPKMTKTFSSVGRNPYASDMERIYEDVLENGPIQVQELRRKNRHAMDKRTFDDTMENLTLMGLLKTALVKGQLCYIIPEEKKK